MRRLSNGKFYVEDLFQILWPSQNIRTLFTQYRHEISFYSIFNSKDERVSFPEHSDSDRDA